MISSPVAGQQFSPSCGLHDKLMERILKEYNERPVGWGINVIGALTELTMTPDGKTWSIVVTRPDGWACLVTGGDNWRLIEPKPVGTAL